MTRSVEIPEAALAKATEAVKNRMLESGSFGDAAQEAIEAALPHLAPAGDGGLREALEKLAARYDSELGTVSYQWLSQKTLKPLLAAHPAAPAVPQPVANRERMIEVLGGSELAAATVDHLLESGVIRDAAVPQPVDREALEAKLAAAITATDLMGCGCCTGSYDYDKYESREDALAAALAACCWPANRNR